MLRIDLPRELENELTLLAALTGKSTQFHVRQAILEYLEDLDDRIVAEKMARRLAGDGRWRTGRPCLGHFRVFHGISVLHIMHYISISYCFFD